MSAIRGDAAEYLCASRVLEAEWQWAWVGSGEAYDGLVCFDPADPNTWWRVQVKRIFMWNGKTPAVNVRRGNEERYEATDADYLACVDMDAGLVYMFPWDEKINGKRIYEKKRMNINHEKHKKYLL